MVQQESDDRPFAIVFDASELVAIPIRAGTISAAATTLRDLAWLAR